MIRVGGTARQKKKLYVDSFYLEIWRGTLLAEPACPLPRVDETRHAGGEGVLYVGRASLTFYVKLIQPPTKIVSNPTSIGLTWN